MSTPQKRSDVVEVHWEHAITWGVIGVLCILVGLAILRYGGIFESFSWPFLAAAPLLGAYAVYRALASRKEKSYTVACPYCSHEIVFTDPPTEDFVCDSCERRVAVYDGRILDVTGVTCGFCQALNYLTEKTEVLICEGCGREIPLLDPRTGEMKRAPKGFARVDDDSLYELLLLDLGRDREAVINSLQHMLALNRNQIKPMLDELPASLLTGINRRKAEMLKAQLEASGATAEFRPLGTSAGA